MCKFTADCPRCHAQHFERFCLTAMCTGLPPEQAPRGGPDHQRSAALSRTAGARRRWSWKCATTPGGSGAARAPPRWRTQTRGRCRRRQWRARSAPRSAPPRSRCAPWTCPGWTWALVRPCLIGLIGRVRAPATEGVSCLRTLCGCAAPGLSCGLLHPWLQARCDDVRAPDAERVAIRTNTLRCGSLAHPGCRKSVERVATGRSNLHDESLTAWSCHAPTESTLTKCQRPARSGRMRAYEAADPPARAAVMKACSSRCARSRRRAAPPWRASAPRSRATPRPPAWRPRPCCRRCSRRRARAAGGSRCAAPRAATAAAPGRQTMRPQQLARESG